MQLMSQELLHQRQVLTEQLETSLRLISETTVTECRKEQQSACNKLEQEIVQLREQLQVSKSNEAETSSSAKLEMVNIRASHKEAVAQLTALHKATENELETIRSKYAAEGKEWEAALAQRDKGSEVFKFAVRGSSGPLHSGSVPQSIFQAEPDSALSRMYNGKWQYVADEEGRALVNSNPENWPIILDWLSFGTIPTNPSASLVSECKYWGLHKFLAAMTQNDVRETEVIETAYGSHIFSIRHVTVAGNAGFSISGKIFDFPKRFLASDDKTTPFIIPFIAAGRDWLLQFSQKQVGLIMCTGPPITVAQWKLQLGPAAYESGPRTEDSVSCDEESVIGDEHALGWPLKESAAELLMHPAMLSIEGSLELAMTVTFKL